MTATLERRIAKLEDSLPPPPEEPGDGDELRRWEAAPEAVQRYLVVVYQEFVAYYGD